MRCDHGQHSGVLVTHAEKFAVPVNPCLETLSLSELAAMLDLLDACVGGMEEREEVRLEGITKLSPCHYLSSICVFVFRICICVFVFRICICVFVYLCVEGK